jgi:hypothetical protein
MSIISECTYQKFTRLEDVEVIKDLSSIGTANECEFQLPVFAYTTDVTDTYRNDFTSTLVQINNRYKDPKIYLEVQNGCTWDEVAQLNDSTYGTYYSTFASKPLWIGYKIDWYLVYNLEGLGCYRIRQEYTDIIENTVKIEYGYKYNLRLWNENLADKTTKLTYKVSGGKIGDTANDERMIDYKDVVWEKEIRLPSSFFGFESSEYTVESTRYKNGASTQTTNEQKQNISFHVKSLPYSLHSEIRTTALQCGDLRISDYNLSNPFKFYDHKRVVINSDYTPTWTTYNTYSPVQLEFNPYFENLRRKLC